MTRKLLIGCGLPLVLFIVLSVVSVRALLRPQPKTQPSETAQRGDVEIKVVENGTIEPLHKEEVKSKVGGRVLSLAVEEGDAVRQSQLLATIDPIDINNDVAALQAQLAAARARLASAQKNTTFQADSTRTSIAQYGHAAAAAAAHLHSAETIARAQPRLTGEAIGIAQGNYDAAVAALQAQQQQLDLLVRSTDPQALVSAQVAYDQGKAQNDYEQRNLSRMNRLVARGFVSQQVADQAEQDAAVAGAHLADTKKHKDLIAEANALQEANVRAQVASARAQVQQAKAALDQAKASTLPDTTRQDLENASAGYQQALAQLAAARAGKTQDLMRQDDASAAAADARQIQNLLDEKLVNLHDTKLYSSIAGVVTKRYLEVGELLTSGIDSFSSGTPVMQVSDLSVMLVKINVNEVDIQRVKVGLPAEVTVDAARGVTFYGRVSKVAPAAASDSSSTSSSSSGSSGSAATSQGVIRFPVEIRIDHAAGRLKPGMSARCAIIVARRRSVLRLPTDCVSGVGSQGTVQIISTGVRDGVKSEITIPRSVVVGLRGDDYVQILSGLSEGERVRPAPYTGPPRKTIDMQVGSD